MRKPILWTVIGLMLILFSLPFIISCTQNARTRLWGGTSRIELDYGEKLVNMTWKNSSLWVLTRQMRKGEVAEEYEFREHSSFGRMEGRIYVTEKEEKELKKEE